MENKETSIDATVIPSEGTVAKKPLPKRKKQTMLNPEWFKQTVALAMKHKASLIFSGDIVWGVCQNRGDNTYVFYPSDKEWCNAVKAVLGLGAIFGGDNIAPASDTFKKMQAYAKIKLNENSAAYINDITSALHVKGAGVNIKSCSFVVTDASVPSLPNNDLADFDYSKVIPKDIHSVMVDCTSKDETRKPLARCCVVDKFDGDTPYICSTDGRRMIAYDATGLPEGFSFNPNVVDIYGVRQFLSHRDSMLKSDIGETIAEDRIINFFMMEDGVLVCELIGSGALNFPNVKLVVPDRGCEFNGTVDGDFLRETLAEISSMGLASGTTYSALTLTEGNITFNTENGVLAVFDGDVVQTEDLPEASALKTTLSYEYINSFSKLGYDLRLCNAAPSVHRSNKLIYIIMPLRVN